MPFRLKITRDQNVRSYQDANEQNGNQNSQAEQHLVTRVTLVLTVVGIRAAAGNGAGQAAILAGLKKNESY